MHSAFIRAFRAAPQAIEAFFSERPAAFVDR
jgi:hypothetical protein